MNFEAIVRAWNVGTASVKGWLFAMPASATKDVELGNKPWGVKGW